MSTLDGRALDLKHAGNRAVAKRDLEAAEGAFRDLIKRAPESVEGYLGLAKTLERAHRDDEIVELLEPVVERLRRPCQPRIALLFCAGSWSRISARRRAA
jgi:hypothetical protein